jgi:hypothetical protein
MGNERWETELARLMAEHENGLYTGWEVSSICMTMLDAPNCSQIWALLLSWVKEWIRARLSDFTEAGTCQEFCVPGSRS